MCQMGKESSRIEFRARGRSRMISETCCWLKKAKIENSQSCLEESAEHSPSRAKRPGCSLWKNWFCSIVKFCCSKYKDSLGPSGWGLKNRLCSRVKSGCSNYFFQHGLSGCLLLSIFICFVSFLMTNQSSRDHPVVVHDFLGVAVSNASAGFHRVFVM